METLYFGPDFPSNKPDNKIFLGGEGMIATANGYCDFLRMLMNKGKLNDKRFLNQETIEEITSPHTQLENKWGYNGYNLWVTSDTLKILGIGDSGLWQGGGYEGTEFWIDSKRGFVGIKMSQLHPIPKSGMSFIMNLEVRYIDKFLPMKINMDEKYTFKFYIAVYMVCLSFSNPVIVKKSQR